MAPLRTEADLQATEAGPLLLNAVHRQNLALSETAKQLDRIMNHRNTRAHQYLNIDPDKAPWTAKKALPQLQRATKSTLTDFDTLIPEMRIAFGEIADPEREA
jgi:hypothetical protein